MADRTTTDRVRELERQAADLQSAIARLPIREAKTAMPRNRVYHFRNCTEPTRGLYVTNPECAAHLPQEPDSPGGRTVTEVAVISTDEFAIECWELIGLAPACKSGDCVDVVAWLGSCDECQTLCFDLVPCDPGPSEYRVCGGEWAEYLGQVIKLTGICYQVLKADSAEGADPLITVDQIEVVYDDCTECETCWELENCFDAADVRWIDNNLEDEIGTVAASLVDQVIRLEDGRCYKVIEKENPCTQTPEHFDGKIVMVGPADAACQDCCYLVTPCPGNPCSAFSIRAIEDDPNIPAGEKLDLLVGKIVRLDDEDQCCYTISRAPNCASVLVGLPDLILEVYDDCDKCVFYRLQECNSNPAIYLCTWSDLSEYLPNSTTDTVILKRAEDGLCYELLTVVCDSEDYPDPCDPARPIFCLSGVCPAPCDPGDPVAEFTVEGEFDSCECCTTPRYRLTEICRPPECDENCGGGGTGFGGETFVTDDDLSTALGQIVKVEGKCYLVECTTDSPDRSGICWEGPFHDCESCNHEWTRVTFVVKQGDGFVGKTLFLPAVDCGEEVVTDDCPAETVVSAFVYNYLVN